MGRLAALSLGDRPGLGKRPVEEGRLVAGWGLEGDRHAGAGLRQLSLLDAAVVDELRAAGAAPEPGALGENLLVADIPLDELAAGARLRIGATAVVEITGPRPVCSSVREVDPHALKVLARRAGLMARVVTSGWIRPGDAVEEEPGANSQEPGGRSSAGC